MKIHKHILIAFFVIITNIIKAQNSISFYNLGDYVVQTQNVSAVYLPKNDFTFGLPGIGFNVNAPFQLNELLVKNSTTNNLDIHFDNLLLNTQTLNHSEININASIFMLTFKIKKGSISVFANSKLTKNWQYTDQFIKVAAKGIDDFNLSDNKLNTTAYNEIGFGITKQFMKDKLAVGVRLKYLNGTGHASIKDNASLSLAIDPTNQFWDTTAANATIKTSGLNSEEEWSAKSFMNITGNSGFGMDFGATYQLSEKWVIELNVNDIGAINWSENNTNYNIKDTQGTTFSGVELDTEGSVKNSIESTLNTVFNPTESIENFSSKLTTNSYYAAKYFANEKSIFTAVFANRVVFGSLKSNYALGYNRMHKKSTYGLLTSIDDQNKKIKFGGNAAVNLGHFQLYAATDDFLNIFGKVQEISQSALNIGINLIF